MNKPLENNPEIKYSFTEGYISPHKNMNKKNINKNFDKKDNDKNENEKKRNNSIYEWFIKRI